VTVASLVDVSTPLADSVAGPADGPDLKWDLLLVCLAGYILTAVGRIHQLFPALELLRPAIVTGALAMVLYLLDRGWSGGRVASSSLRSSTS